MYFKSFNHGKIQDEWQSLFFGRASKPLRKYLVVDINVFFLIFSQTKRIIDIHNLRAEFHNYQRSKYQYFYQNWYDSLFNFCWNPKKIIPSLVAPSCLHKVLNHFLLLISTLFVQTKVIYKSNSNNCIV